MYPGARVSDTRQIRARQEHKRSVHSDESLVKIDIHGLRLSRPRAAKSTCNQAQACERVSQCLWLCIRADVITVYDMLSSSLMLYIIISE